MTRRDLIKALAAPALAAAAGVALPAARKDLFIYTDPATGPDMSAVWLLERGAGGDYLPLWPRGHYASRSATATLSQIYAWTQDGPVIRSPKETP